MPVSDVLTDSVCVLIVFAVSFLLGADLRQELAVQQKQERTPSISLPKGVEKPEATPARPSSVVISALSSLHATPSRPPGSGTAFNTPSASYSRSEHKHSMATNFCKGPLTGPRTVSNGVTQNFLFISIACCALYLSYWSLMILIYLLSCTTSTLYFAYKNFESTK